MANRSYLYSAKSDMKTLRDISEWRSEVPLFYMILLGINPSLELSIIWDYAQPIAIKSDFKKGLQRFYDFYEYLSTQPGFDKEKILGYIQNTKAFFEEYPERALDYFFMEGGEAYDLIASENNPIEKENQYIFDKIVSISKDIEEILNAKYDDISKFSGKFYWITEIIKDASCLEPYWTYVTYFSFNKSGQS